MEVVVMAAMVPIGIDFWASRRSPERLEPAMIPEQTGEGQMLSRSMWFMHTHIRNTIHVLEAAEYQSVSYRYLRKVKKKTTPVQT